MRLQDTWNDAAINAGDRFFFFCCCCWYNLAPLRLQGAKLFWGLQNASVKRYLLPKPLPKQNPEIPRIITQKNLQRFDKLFTKSPTKISSRSIFATPQCPCTPQTPYRPSHRPSWSCRHVCSLYWPQIRLASAPTDKRMKCSQNLWLLTTRYTVHVCGL